jgi:iron only hydrogenase large subunit-like protein
VVHACDPSCFGGGGRRITSLSQVHETLSHAQNKNQRTGGLAQVVDHLPSQLEGLGINLQYHTIN